MKIRNFVLKLIPRKLRKKFIEPLINAYDSKVNQKEILKISRDKQLIFLKPVLLGGGNIEHYYHFIFDLIFPLSNLINNSPDNSTFLIEEFGIYSDRVNLLFSDRARAFKVSETLDNVNFFPLIGLNPRYVFLTHRSIQMFCSDIYKRLQITPVTRPNKILLVERLPPDAYFLEKAKIKGSGASRRSILNHEDLRNTISYMVKESFEFHNVQLEKMCFLEQVDCFSKACVVFAQHGAGLANCLWMNPRSIVIEFSHEKSHDNFKIISKLKKHTYYWYKTSNKHARIELDDFSEWVLRQVKLKDFFCKIK